MQEDTILLSRRRSRIVLVVGLLLVIALALWSARGALLPYILAAIFIYLLLPVVNLLDGRLTRLLKNPRPARALAILLVYLACLALAALFVSMIIPVLVQQFSALWEMRNNMLGRVQGLAVQWLGWYRTNVPAMIQTQINDNLQKAGDSIAGAVQAGVGRTFTIVTNTVGLIISLVVIPVWMFYVLYDQAGMSRAASNLVPDRYRADAHNIWHLVDAVLGAYVRGQFVLCVTIGFMATAGLTLLHVPFPLVLGVTAGLFEFLPYIGPVLGAIPAVLVALVQSPILALWTILLYVGIQQLENLVLAPRIAGGAVQLHPRLDHPGVGDRQRACRPVGDAGRRAGHGNRPRRLLLSLLALPG